MGSFLSPNPDYYSVPLLGVLVSPFYGKTARDIKWLPWGRGTGTCGSPVLLNVAHQAFALSQRPPVKRITVEGTVNASAKAVLSFFSPDEVRNVGAQRAGSQRLLTYLHPLVTSCSHQHLEPGSPSPTPN